MATQQQIDWLKELGVEAALQASAGQPAGADDDESPGTSGQATPAAKPAKPVTVEGEKIGGDMRAFEETFRRVTKGIIDTVEINALLLGAGIEAACIDFKKFTDDKIEAMRHAEEMDKLALEILEVCATAVSGGFADLMIEGELAPEVFKKLAEGTIKVVKAKAEPNTSADFAKFVESLIVGAKQSGQDAGNAAIAIVRATVVAAEKAFSDARNNGKSLSDSKEYAFVERFLFADASKFDHLVQRFAGIPTPQAVNKVQIKLTGDMIGKFTAKWIRATRNPVETALTDPEVDANIIASRAMEVLKRNHKFNYDE